MRRGSGARCQPITVAATRSANNPCASTTPAMRPIHSARRRGVSCQGERTAYCPSQAVRRARVGAFGAGASRSPRGVTAERCPASRAGT
jgi:hypothetical protein